MDFEWQNAIKKAVLQEILNGQEKSMLKWLNHLRSELSEQLDHRLYSEIFL